MLYHAPATTLKESNPDRAAQLSVGFILLPSFSLVSLAAMLDLFRHTAESGLEDGQARCIWTVMGASLEPVQASSGVAMAPLERLGDPGRFHYVIIVGGETLPAGRPSDQLIEYLRLCSDRGTRLAGVGSGAAILAEAGLAGSKRICVHWSSFPEFMDRFDDVDAIGDQIFVVDGNRITCAGGFAAADLAHWMLTRHCGNAAAQHSQNQALLASVRSANCAQPHPAHDRGARNERVKRAIILMEQRLCEPLQVAEIAAQVSVSKRQLERLFQRDLGTSIQSFSRWLRIRYGLWKLIHTTVTVTQIAHECGFSDSSHFCRTFSGMFGRSPTEVRMDKAYALRLYSATETQPGAELIAVEPEREDVESQKLRSSPVVARVA